MLAPQTPAPLPTVSNPRFQFNLPSTQNHPHDLQPTGSGLAFESAHGCAVSKANGDGFERSSVLSLFPACGFERVMLICRFRPHGISALAIHAQNLHRFRPHGISALCIYRFRLHGIEALCICRFRPHGISALCIHAQSLDPLSLLLSASRADESLPRL